MTPPNHLESLRPTGGQPTVDASRDSIGPLPEPMQNRLCRNQLNWAILTMFASLAVGVFGPLVFYFRLGFHRGVEQLPAGWLQVLRWIEPSAMAMLMHALGMLVVASYARRRLRAWEESADISIGRNHSVRTMHFYAWALIGSALLMWIVLIILGGNEFGLLMLLGDVIEASIFRSDAPRVFVGATLLFLPCMLLVLFGYTAWFADFKTWNGLAQVEGTGALSMPTSLTPMLIWNRLFAWHLTVVGAWVLFKGALDLL